MSALSCEYFDPSPSGPNGLFAMSDYYAINDTMTQLNDNVSTDSNASESNPTLAHIACDFMWPFHNRSDITHCVLHQFPISNVP